MELSYLSAEAPIPLTKYGRHRHLDSACEHEVERGASNPRGGDTLGDGGERLSPRDSQARPQDRRAQCWERTAEFST